MILKRVAMMAALVLFADAAFPKFLPGYIVDLNGDTVRGLINHQRWERNPKKISYKKSESSAVETYSPLDIRAFYVGDKYYESFITEVDVSPFKHDLLNFSAVPELATDTVFLESIFKGHKDLFYLKDKLGKQHFFISAGGRIELLSYKKYYKYVKDAVVIYNQVKIVAENTKFKNQLLNHLADCDRIRSQIEGSRYELSSLIEVFMEYHSCLNMQVKHVENSRDANVRNVNVIVGGTISNLKITGAFTDLFDALNDTDFKSSIRPTFGASFETLMLRSGLGYSGNVMFTTYEITGDHTDFQNADYYTTTDASFRFGYVKLLHMIVYKFSPRPAGFYLKFGPSISFILSDKAKVRVFKKFYVTETESYEPFITRKIEIGGAFGVGYRFPKVSVEAAYELTNGFSSYVKLSSRVDRIYLTAQYRVPLRADR